MTAEVSLFLFGKPDWEINLEKATPRDIKTLGEELRARLAEIGEVLAKLERAGWDRSAGLYDIFLYKDVSKTDAEKELKALGLKDLEVVEWEDEE